MGGGFGWFFGLIFWIFIIWLIVYLVRGGVAGIMKGGESARDILDKRYAKGEITKEDYDRMKKELGG